MDTQIHDRPFLFSCGTGDLWTCATVGGCGFYIEQLTDYDNETYWSWCTQREHWSEIGRGQTAGRDDAIEAACASLVAAGIDLDQLPQDQAELAMFKERRARQQSLEDCFDDE